MVQVLVDARFCGASNRNATKPDLNRFNWIIVSFVHVIVRGAVLLVTFKTTYFASCSPIVNILPFLEILVKPNKKALYIMFQKKQKTVTLISLLEHLLLLIHIVGRLKQ